MKKCACIRPLVILIIACLTQGCRTSTILQSTSANHIIKGVANEKYIAIHAAADYQAGTSHYKCPIKIHIQRDSMIWFSATHHSGIELARGRLTPLGIEIINHIEKVYQVFDYRSLELNWEMPFNYALIQAMLLGELPNIGIDTKKSESGNKIIVEQEQAFWKFLATIGKNTQNLTSLTITNKVTGNKGVIFYEYKKDCTQNFLFCDAKAYFTKFNLKLRYRKVTLSKQPLSSSFKIPAYYVNQ
ncbi:MAG: hypothetical protein BGO68_00085 [Candidatus Amoebophilus sp. 36-38]|nr:MAG: hypothetical protein BGO68_00085 [Candidatus Amoebophilus sp. 36-38]